MSWEEVLIYVIEAVASVIVAVAIPMLFKAIRSKTDNEIALSLIAQAEKTVTDCVLMVNQTYVDALKAEGTFNAQAADVAYAKCRSEVLEILSDAAKAAIINTVGDFEGWLKTQIESNVRTSKLWVTDDAQTVA